MKIFAPLYDHVIKYAAHRHAVRYLCGLSFIESSIFPLPPDIVLIPMAVAEPQRAWYFAALTTIFSVVGGIAGYLIGFYLFDLIAAPIIAFYDAFDKFQIVKSWYDKYGVLVVLVAGFTPVPYKLFTITSGWLELSMPIFIIASLIGRGARFYLVAGLAKWGGTKYSVTVRKNVEVIGWSVLGVVVVGVVIYLWLAG